MLRSFVAAALVAVVLSSCAAAPQSLGGDPTSAPLNELTPDVAVACVEDGEIVDDSAAVSASEANAMPDQDFWGYIDILEGGVTETGLGRLTDALVEKGIDAVLAFDVRLALSLYDLDSACRAEWYRLNEPAQLGFVSDDTFLYARADTVAAGQAVWQEAVDSNTLPWGESDPSTGMGELLLYVGLDAAEQLDVPVEEYFDQLFALLAISFETGSNPNGWPQ